MNDSGTDVPTERHAASRADLEALLAQIAEDLSGQIDLDQLLMRIVSAARHVTGAPYAALGVLAPSGESLVRFIHEGMDPDTVRRIGPHPTGGGLLGELIRHPEPLVVDQLDAHPAYRGFPPNHPPMTNFLGVPVRAGGRIFGNLYLTDRADGFTEEDLRAVAILAAQAGAAIHAAELADRLRDSAVQDERERISRDLHDGVIQSLFSVGMGLEGAKALIDRDPTRLQTRIDIAVDQLDDTIREIRNTIFTLRPGSADLGLQRGLVDLAREYEVNEILRPVLNVSQSLDVHVEEELVPDVLHIVREALSNVAKHATATQVMLDAEIIASDLVISVRDTGGGFDADTVARGNGLENMAERAVLLGAHLGVTSTIGEGTTVTLTVPLHPTAPEQEDYSA
ncbi:MAG: GAF domain-containing sensor histidine kinase [Actinomycetota bacterium]